MKGMLPAMGCDDQVLMQQNARRRGNSGFDHARQRLTVSYVPVSLFNT